MDNNAELDAAAQEVADVLLANKKRNTINSVKAYWRGYSQGFRDGENPFRWFHKTFLQKKLPYSPQLIGVRPLENGRLALCFRNSGLDPENSIEVKVFDLWKCYASWRDVEPNNKWFDPGFFKTAYVLGDFICWGETDDLDICISDLYEDSDVVEEDFRCLK